MKVFIKNLKAIFLKNRLKNGIVAVSFIIILLLGWKLLGNKNKQQEYQTAQVTKGMLVISLAESGQIVSTGNLPVTTQASGIITAVLVKNGDTVTQGQEIMDITPDQATVQAQTQALVEYNNAVTNKMASQAQLEKDRQAVITVASSVTTMQNNISVNAANPATKLPYTQNDIDAINSGLTSTRETFSIDEKKYLQADTAITLASQSVQQLSSIVLSPNAGVINNITFASGMAIHGGSQTVTTGTEGNSATTNGRSSATIAMIVTDQQTTPAATFDLSEVDAPKVQEGQQATITIDAFAGKTFTGKVIGVNREGVVSSGVVNYPVTIQLDTVYPNMSPNMSATANIIISTKQDVLLVPTAAVQTNTGQSTIRILKNGKITTIPVEIGSSSATQTEIISGLHEGDSVVTSILSPKQTATNGTSPFSRSLVGGSGFGGIRGGGGRGQ